MSVYIHIPFCKAACSYCDFHFSVNHEKMDQLVDALVMEIQLRRDYLGTDPENRILRTIYFGGGTPSLLSESQLNRIFDALSKHFDFAPGIEITLEANPDDLTVDKLAQLKRTPVNRLSIGVQSFFDEHLALMRRTHSAQSAAECINNAAAAGFGNITIDLIYGVPGMSNDEWQMNMDKAFALPIQHLSAYCLTIENRTLLNKLIRDGKVAAPDEDLATEHFEMLMRSASANQFEHYEISNFARGGKYSVHNTSYWQNKPYLGIGPSAHSFNGISRQWNVAANATYVLNIAAGKIPAESETLSLTNRHNEYLMTGLRTMWGVDLNVLQQDFGPRVANDFLEGTQRYISDGLMERQQHRFFLTTKGKLLADRIASELFQSELQ